MSGSKEGHAVICTCLDLESGSGSRSGSVSLRPLCSDRDLARLIICLLQL